MRKNSSNFTGIVMLIWALIVIFGCIGYIKDIVHLFQCDFASPYKAEVFYIIGACTGLGAIFGWIGFGK